MKMKKKYAWKILRKGMRSDLGNIKWYKNKWKTHKQKLELCSSGFHASKLLFDAIQYVTPGIICLVEYSGKMIDSDDKFVAERMRVIKTYRFTKRIAVEWSIYCARLCLKSFEKKYPKDKRVREVINTAENWLNNPTQKNRFAAVSAWSVAVSAAESAWSVAGFAAVSAAWSTWSVARFAAMSAAWSAAWSTAKPAIKKKMSNKLMKIIGYKK